MPVGPTDAAGSVPLHLVNIAADRVDWDRTNRYAESARTVHYFETQAEADYAALSNDVARTLNEVALATDAAKRLALVEGARKALAEWPRNHYNYRAAEMRQMLTLLDEAITDLRAANAPGKFDLSLSAFASRAARARADAAAADAEGRDRADAARGADERIGARARGAARRGARRPSIASAPTLPADWVGATRADAKAALEAEHRVDRQLRDADQAHPGAGAAARRARRRPRARAAARRDSSPRRRARQQAARRDQQRSSRACRSGSTPCARCASRAIAGRCARPRIASIARRSATPVDVLALFARVTPALEDIKALAGSSAGTLVAVHRAAARILARASAIDPPEELRAGACAARQRRPDGEERRRDPARGDARRQHPARVGRLVGRRRRADARGPGQQRDPVSSSAARHSGDHSAPDATRSRRRSARLPPRRRDPFDSEPDGRAARSGLSRLVVVPTRGAALQLRRTIECRAWRADAERRPRFRDARSALRSAPRAAAGAAAAA